MTDEKKRAAFAALFDNGGIGGVRWWKGIFSTWAAVAQAFFECGMAFSADRSESPARVVDFLRVEVVFLDTEALFSRVEAHLF